MKKNSECDEERNNQKGLAVKKKKKNDNDNEMMCNERARQ
jgi:hypothetical protein